MRHVIVQILLIMLVVSGYSQTLEEYRNQREKEYQQYLTKRDEDMAKLKKQFEEYKAQINSDRERFLRLGDTVAVAVIDEIIEYEETLEKSNLTGKEPEEKEVEAKVNDLPEGCPLGKQFCKVTSSFGYRIHPVLKSRRLHTGIDFAAPLGTSLLATANGEVVFAGYNGGYGNFIIIKHLNGYATAYAHLSSIKLSKGQFVRRGDVVGLVGSTGRSTGNHLHYEVRFDNIPVDPSKYL